ncbi:MAG: 3-coathanger stack domain-containing protein [Bacteroidota bacterium]
MILKAGFHAKAGTNFTAKIADCPQSGFKTDRFVDTTSERLRWGLDKAGPLGDSI